MSFQLKPSAVHTLIGIGVGIVLFLLTFGVEQYYRFHVSNLRSNDGKEHTYNIYPGTSVDSVLNMLRKDYTISGELDLRWHMRLMVFTRPEPGHYAFPAEMGDKEFINRLKLGEQTPVLIKWNNTCRTREELAGKVTSRLMMDSVSLLRLLEDDAFLKQYGFDRETSRCLFIPNTYEVYWTITPDALFARMQREYNAFWNQERRQKAEEIGLNPIEVSILASIVESETYNSKDMPTIASLYLNRLRLGMPLQACPTVKYAVGDFTLRRILNKHLAVESPFNTYLHTGLPPAPICLPSKETIKAVVFAPQTDFLYFCASPTLDGTHRFAATLAEHNRNAAAYHAALNRQGIKR